MSMYVILSRITPPAFKDLKECPATVKKVDEALKAECPGLRSTLRLATLGRYDVIDIVETDDPAEVERASMILRSIAQSETETLPATPWAEFVRRLQRK